MALVSLSCGHSMALVMVGFSFFIFGLESIKGKKISSWQIELEGWWWRTNNQEQKKQNGSWPLLRKIRFFPGFESSIKRWTQRRRWRHRRRQRRRRVKVHRDAKLSLFSVLESEGKAVSRNLWHGRFLFMVSSSKEDFALMARILVEVVAGSAGFWRSPRAPGRCSPEEREVEDQRPR